MVSVYDAGMPNCFFFLSLLSHIVLTFASRACSVCARFYLPQNVVHTKGGMRGRKPWFTERDIQIAVTRLVRDDPSKRLYEYVISLANSFVAC